MLHICRDLLRAEPAPQAQKKLLRSLQELRYPSGTGATVCSAGCSLGTGSCSPSLLSCGCLQHGHLPVCFP